MGTLLSVYNNNWPPKAKWSTSNIPDLTGQVIVVTGGNSGIGKETVKALLNHNAKVYILSRDPSRAADAIQSLKADTGKEAHFIQMDLADLGSVKTAAEEFRAKETALNVLINNAGVMVPDPKAVTKQGYDLQFGVNVLGPYYLTTLLLPELQAASSGSGSPGLARVVNLSSAGHTICPGINWETVSDSEVRRKTPMFDLYNQSKFATVVFASELAKRYSDKIVSTSLHPGLIKTDISRNIPRPIVKVLSLFAYDAYKGALTSLYAATAPENANANGQYFIAWARKSEPNPKALDPEVGTKLWTWCEEQVKGL